MKKQSSKLDKVEIRGFMQLDSFLRNEYGSMPIFIDVGTSINGYKLAEKLGISHSEIEVIFVNGFAQNLEYIINNGDRVAFLPPGCPGPYRIALGFYSKNKGKE